MRCELITCKEIGTLELQDFLEEANCFGEKCNPLWETYEIGTARWMIKITLHEETLEEYYLAFKVDGMLTGVCRVTPCPKHKENGQIGFYIRPSMRGKQFASKFLRMIEEFCRHIRIQHPTACVEVGNIKSLKAFRLAGWKPTGKRYDWTEGRTAIEMSV